MCLSMRQKIFCTISKKRAPKHLITTEEKIIMEKANQNIRKQIKGLGLYQWQLADAVGVSNYSFTIWMRHAPSGCAMR